MPDLEFNHGQSHPGKVLSYDQLDLKGCYVDKVAVLLRVVEGH